MIGGFDLCQLREINYQMLRVAIARKGVSGTAIIDGTSWGGRLYSCLCLITRWGDVWLADFEPIEKQGKELLASQRLVERFCRYMGKGVIELLLADMLYFNERFWQLREAGYVKDILVKYTPGNDALLSAPYRKVLQEFEAMKALHCKPEKTKTEKRKLSCMGFSAHEGYDQSRGVGYRIYQLRNNSRDNRWQIGQVLEVGPGGKQLPPF